MDNAAPAMAEMSDIQSLLVMALAILNAVWTSCSMTALYRYLVNVLMAYPGCDLFGELLALVSYKLWKDGTCPAAHTVVGRSRFGELLGRVGADWPDVLCRTETVLNDEELRSCLKRVQESGLSRKRTEFLDHLLECIVSESDQAAKGQFFTLRHVADFIIRMLSPRPKEILLDPACGSGMLLLSALRQCPNLREENCVGFDYDDKAIRVARLLMYVEGRQHCCFEALDALKPPSISDRFPEIGGSPAEYVLRRRLGESQVDMIATNPPFSVLVDSGSLPDEYVLSKRRGRVLREVLFLERCERLLKPSGKLAIILPSRVLSSVRDRYIREWLYDRFRVYGIVSLPNTMFQPYTEIQTDIIFARKRSRPLSAGASAETHEKVMMAICQQSGKDGRGNLLYRKNQRRSTESVRHDLNDIRDAFQRFVSDETLEW
ncbi:HsdM family class I SAM-dependent methyltransferase [Bifidobacterium callitrichos]|nr:N-6 DNA methylase [Bifidobacterium callitrichos]